MKLLDNVNESDLIFFDIETAKAVEKIEKGTPIWDAWAYKSRYENELNRKTGKEYTPQEYFDDKSALYAVFGKVVAIVAGRINEDVLFTKRYTGNRILPRFADCNSGGTRFAITQEQHGRLSGV